MNTNSTNSGKRSIWRLVRTSFLGSFLALALLLMHWSREHDPRFFWFVQSPPGRLLADTLSWQTGIRPVHEKVPVEAWSDAERTALEGLKKTLMDTTPDTRLIMKDGRKLKGRVVEESDEAIHLEVRYEADLGVRMRLAKEKVLDREALDSTLPALSLRDVRFHMEFPEYGFFRRPPFTVITDRSAFDAEDAVIQLHQLHGRLLQDFEELVRFNDKTDGIQLLFFSSEDSYRIYTESIAPHLEFSSGFYTPALDRLVWFDQRGSNESASLRQSIDDAAASSQQRATHPDQQRRIERAAMQARRHLHHAGESESRRVLRHEGTHQLLFTFGIHSDHMAENPWLLEGMAQYYEERPAGAIPLAHRPLLEAPPGTNDPVSTEALINQRAAQGLHAWGDPELITLAYVRSAALVRWMMRADNRPSFLRYLRELREPANVWRASTEDRVTWLADTFGDSREHFLARIEREAF